MMYTFYQSVYYASHNQSFPSTREEKHAFWVGFGEHVGDAVIHKLLDSSSNKTLYRSAVCPADDIHPNNMLLHQKSGRMEKNLAEQQVNNNNKAKQNERTTLFTTIPSSKAL